MFNVHPRVFFLYLFYFVFFFFTRSGQNEKHLSLFLLPSLKLTIFLILYKNMSLSTLLILAGRGTRVIYELRNGLSSPKSLCGSVVEHWYAESKGLRFDFSCPMLVTRGKIYFSLS